MLININVNLFDADKNLWTNKTDVSVSSNGTQLKFTVINGKGVLAVPFFLLGQYAQITAKYNSKIFSISYPLFLAKKDITTVANFSVDIFMLGEKSGKRTINTEIKQDGKFYAKEVNVTILKGNETVGKQTVTNGQVSLVVNHYDTSYVIKASIQGKSVPISKNVTVYKTRVNPKVVVIDIPKKAGDGNTKPGTDSVQIVNTETPYLYYRPETAEVIEIVDKQEAARIQKESNELTQKILAIQNANNEVTKAINAYDKKPSELTAQAVDVKNKKLLQEEEEFRKKLASLGIKATPESGNQLIELIPLSEKYTNNKSRFNRKFTYATGPKKAAHWKNYKLGPPEGSKSNSQFVEKGKNGRYRINGKELSNSIKQNTKLTAKVNTATIEGTLTDWAEEWTKSAQGSYSNGMIDLGGAAQFMRYSAGAGAAVEFNPSKGTLLAKASANASFAIAQAGGALDIYIPSKSGLHFSFSDIDMGRFRLLLAINVSGFVGASVAVEAGIEIKPSERSKGKNVLTGAPIKTENPQPFRGPIGRTMPLDKWKEDDKIDISADLFAGASGSANFTGALEWASPETNKFKQFASISPGVAGQAGIGVAFSFGIYFKDGKLKGHIKAGICVGLGGKGTLAIEIDVILIAEFLIWSHYQLCRLGAKLVLSIIDGSAWDNLSQIAIVAIDMTKTVIQYTQTRIRSLASDFARLQVAYASVSNSAPRRNQLAMQLGKRPNDLLHAPPRAKGFYLHELTRHGFGTGTNYSTRENAIFAVLYSIQTREEWSMVFNRMRPIQDNNIGGGTENRKGLQRFLREELSSKRVQEVENIFAQLKAEEESGKKMGWKAVWRDQKQQVAMSHDRWESYVAHNGHIPGVTHFYDRGFDILESNQDTRIV